MPKRMPHIPTPRGDQASGGRDDYGFGAAADKYDSN